MSKNGLQATYRSSETSETFQQEVPLLPSSGEELDVKRKTEYLAALRGSISSMQNEVNIFLTRKMEEEKAADSSARGKTKEEKEEENYGEEDPDDGG